MAWAGSSLGWAEVLGWGKGKGRRPGWAARGKRKLGSAGLLGWIHFFFFFLYFLFLFLTQTQAKFEFEFTLALKQIKKCSSMMQQRNYT